MGRWATIRAVVVVLVLVLVVVVVECMCWRVSGRKMGSTRWMVIHIKPENQ